MNNQEINRENLIQVIAEQINLNNRFNDSRDNHPLFSLARHFEIFEEVQSLIN